MAKKKKKPNPTKYLDENDPNIKLDEKWGKKAVDYLKREALKEARMGRQPHGQHTGTILNHMGISRGWDPHSKAYRAMIRWLNHGIDLGLIKESGWGSPKRFAYDGPEVQKAIDEFEDGKKLKRKQIEACMRKLRVKGSIIEAYRGRKDDFDVRFNADQLVRLVNRVRAK